MKGIQIRPEIELQIDLNVTSYIPDEYIQDPNQKIEIYQNIALCKNEQDIQNIIDEIIDRFGNMPKEVEKLIQIAKIKYLAKNLKISKIASKNTVVVFTFEPNQLKIDITELVKKYGNKIKFSNSIKPMITLETGTKEEQQILTQVTQFLLGITGTGTE